MKRFALTFLCLALFCTCSSFFRVDRTVTKEGRVILLFPNGTWRELSGPGSQEWDKRLENMKRHDEFVLGGKGEYGVHYDPTEWVMLDARKGKAYDMEFRQVDGDAFAYILFSPKAVGESTLYKMAFENANSVMGNIEVPYEDRRLVNGNELLVLSFLGTRGTTYMAFHGYYYTGKKGTIQFVAYSTARMFEQMDCMITRLLSGLVIDP